MPAHGLMGRRVILLNPGSQNNYNVYTAAGSPGDQVIVVVTVAFNVTINQMSTGTAWAAGSVLKLVNLGLVKGDGGRGGAGASDSEYAGGDGENGKDALTLGWDLTIDNGSGRIFGGGGGGGGGGSANIASNPPGIEHSGGGGGGGGAGNSTGGPGGHGSTANGTNGDAGTVSGSGAGGAGGGSAGAGGNGGYWGWYGGNGGKGLPGSGGIGGSPGNAVTRNGHTVTWLAGNDSTHVKGAVS